MEVQIDKSFENFVDEYYRSLSFKFDTFEEAESELEYGKYSIKYDRFSLCCYSHSFPMDLWKAFSKRINDKYKVCKKEVKKTRAEYGILLAYAEQNKELLTAKITKEERPDFIIFQENKRKGIEITELAMPTDKVLAKILNENNNCKVDPIKIRDMARAKHGNKALCYGYHNINGTLAMSTKLINFEMRKKIYADSIIKKYNKYINEFCEFDEFIILCFLSDPLINDANEVEEIMDMFIPNKKYGNLKVSILYNDKNDNVQVLERIF